MENLSTTTRIESSLFCVFGNPCIKFKLASCQGQLGIRGSIRTDNMFLLLGHLTSAKMANNLSNVSLQARPVESIFNNLNRLVLTEMSSQTPACNSQEKKSLRDVRELCTM